LPLEGEIPADFRWENFDFLRSSSNGSLGGFYFEVLGLVSI